jgi:subtilase family serine protease
MSQGAVLHLSFALRGDDSALHAYLAELYDPSSPNYHHWLTQEQFGTMFGASDADVLAVARWAQSNGMTVTDIWPNHRFISASIPATKAQSVLNVHLQYFTSNGTGTAALVYAPDRDPTLPDDIAARVAYVFGLSNAMKAEAPRLKVSAADAFGAAAIPEAVEPLSNPLGPSQLSTIYDLARLQSAGYTGKNLKIGVYSPTLYFAADAQQFESTYGITAPTPIEEWPASTGRATDDSDAQEADLDVETIMGQAPSAQIVLYEAPNDGTSTPDQFNQIASDNPPLVSFSYTFPEATAYQQGIEQLDTIVAQMAAQGETVVGASGDNGPYDNGGTTPSVGYPASSVYCTGVGGTALPDSNGGYWYNEIAWNDSTGITGGGLSLFFAIPTWQVGPDVQNSQSNGMRQVPDVSSLAGSPGVSIYSVDDNGQNPTWQDFGGTSASAPFWAAALVDFDQAIGKREGNYDPDLYKISQNAATYASSYHDITVGSDQLFSCMPGWDYMTGLGSADFYELYLNVSDNLPVHEFSQGLQMISVPYNYNGAALSSLFDAATVLAVYNPATPGYSTISSTTPSATLQAGTGYWISAANPLNLIKTGPAVASPNKAVLPAGWNMIADPYTVAVSIGSLDVIPSGSTTAVPWAKAVADGLVSGALYTYPAGSTDYTAIDAVSSLQPFAGYWIDVLKTCTIEYPAS